MEYLHNVTRMCTLLLVCKQLKLTLLSYAINKLLFNLSLGKILFQFSSRLESRAEYLISLSFPSSLLPQFQNESSSETIEIKMSLISLNIVQVKYIHMNGFERAAESQVTQVDAIDHLEVVLPLKMRFFITESTPAHLHLAS